MSTHDGGPHTEGGQNPGYEQRDVSLGVLIKWLVGLFVFVALSAVLALGTYFILTLRGGSGNVEWPQSSLDEHNIPKDLPVLQGNPVKDIKDFRLDEDKELTSYKWVDAKAGVAQIPVDRALEIIATRGLPDKVDSTREEKFYPDYPPAIRFGDPSPRAIGAVESPR